MALVKVNAAEFGQRINDAGDAPVLILFTSPTCAPCKAVKKLLEPMRTEVLEVDISTDLEVAQRYLVNAVPTLVLDTLDSTRSRVVGNKQGDITALVKQYETELAQVSGEAA